MSPDDLLDPALDLIVLVRGGAHLYGTATEDSDLDLKGVYLPMAEDILLQRVRPTVTLGSVTEEGERRRAGKVEIELFSLDRYFDLLAAGQTVALDLLWAPDEAMLRTPAPLWQRVRAATPRLVTRRAGSFLRYARRQAALFGLKGGRLAAARRTLTLLEDAVARLGTTAKLGTIAPELEALAAGQEHVALALLPTASGGTLAHLDLGGRRVPFTASLGRARELAAHVVATYGRRAREAERNEGVDWKALSHAVRIGRQALKLLTTGRLRFPLACAPHLLAIKRGERPYAEVAAEIEALVTEVEAAAARSILPDAPDQAFLDGLVLEAYGAKVAAWHAARTKEARR